jgi:hypothetical protein
LDTVVAKRWGHTLGVSPSEKVDHLTLKPLKKRYRGLAGDTVGYFIPLMGIHTARRAKAVFPPKPEGLGFHT